MVAVNEDRLLGTVALEEYELLSFFVHPDCQDEGIGSQLLAAIRQLAAASVLRCEASLTGTPFYERNGYLRTGLTKAGIAGK